MALDQSALLELLGDLKLTDVNDRIRFATETLYQELIDAEAAAFTARPRTSAPASAARCQSAGDDRRAVRADDPETADRLVLPVAAGAAAPSRSGPVRRRDGGLPARRLDRKVDDLAKALGADTGISKSEVSRICADLDEEVAAFRDRPPEDAYPYAFLDATHCKARVSCTSGLETGPCAVRARGPTRAQGPAESFAPRSRAQPWMTSPHAAQVRASIAAHDLDAERTLRHVERDLAAVQDVARAEIAP